jgi:crotonobetainyl-CoA:carnitine CoA-transferase CaiB-like acyl-CoA transferase
LPPHLGEQGREILQEIGMRTEEIEALASNGGVMLPGDKEKVA